jgi:hypothetical protein
MYTPRTAVEAIPNTSIHHSALQNRDFGHTYDRARALVRAIGTICFHNRPKNDAQDLHKKKGLERRPLRFSTICAKNQVLKLNIDKVAVILRRKCLTSDPPLYM